MNEINWDNVDIGVEKFSLKDYNTMGKCVKVYDGDTVHLAFVFGGMLYRWVCRLEGVDTPELRTSNEKEKEMGYMVKSKLEEKILGKVINVCCGEFDKYGRLLVKLYIPGVCDEEVSSECVNSWLIENGYAYSYDGGKKKKWE